MSICKFKNFSRGYTPGPPVNRGREKGEEEKGKGGKGMGRRRIDEGYRTGGGENGIRKKGKGRGGENGSTPPV
jgi:hypothetical protein